MEIEHENLLDPQDQEQPQPTEQAQPAPNQPTQQALSPTEQAQPTPNQPTQQAQPGPNQPTQQTQPTPNQPTQQAPGPTEQAQPTPNQPTQQEPGPRSISPSQLKVYEDCPKKWMFRYIENLPDPSGLPAVIGSFAHSVLEDLMGLAPDERSKDRAQTIAREKFGETQLTLDFKQLNLGPPAIVRFKWRAWNVITKLWTLEDPQQVEVVGIESKLSLQVAGVPFLGYIDRLDNSQQGLVVNDYKSGKPNFPGPNSNPDRRHLEDSHVFQVMLYAAAITEELSNMPAKIRLLYLGETSGEITEEVTPAKLEDVKAKLIQVWGEIQESRNTNTFIAKTSPLCGWCPFLAHCQEGMETVIQLKDTGKLKETAPAWRLKEILFNNEPS